MKSHTLGVVVGRFQVPDLSDGHRFLIDAVRSMHDRVLIVLGETPARLTQSAPMDYYLREAMILDAYPDVCVVRLFDQPSDKLWSQHLDALIDKMTLSMSTDLMDAILYGGRDSFASHYKGLRRIITVPPVKSESGERIRLMNAARHTSDFRAGVVWASQYKYPVSHQCVDMALVDGKGNVLVAKKWNDEGYRFPGGYVDPRDESLERAAKRELREETGVEPGDPVYIGSFRIDDYRYRKAADSIMTALFVVPICWGDPKAADDIDSVAWEPIDDETRLQMLPHYVPLFDAVQNYMEKRNAK